MLRTMKTIPVVIALTCPISDNDYTHMTAYTRQLFLRIEERGRAYVREERVLPNFKAQDKAGVM